MSNEFDDLVVVITGASSGVGKALALKLAANGASLALAARRISALSEVANQCEEQGGRAIAIRCDVSKEPDVRELAQKTLEKYGHIDVWINNAGVYLLGPFLQIPLFPFRQVIETNFFGTMYGSRMSLEKFTEQGYGMLINIASVFGKAGAALASPYNASKFAVVGFTESLRQEFINHKNIHICTVIPATLDTPLYDHSANFEGRNIRPVPPVYRSEDVANAVKNLILNPRHEIYVGEAGRTMVIIQRFTPTIFAKIMNIIMRKLHFGKAKTGMSQGNLFEPVEEGTGISGGWTRNTKKEENLPPFSTYKNLFAFLLGFASILAIKVLRTKG